MSEPHTGCTNCARTYLCRKHQRLCCDNCKSGDCEPVPFEKLDLNTIRNEILPKAVKTLGTKLSAKDLKGSVEARGAELSAKKEEAKKELHARFEEIRDALNKREAALVAELDQICEEDCYRDIARELSELDKARTVLELGKKTEKEWDDARPKDMVAACCDVRREANRVERLMYSAERAAKETIGVKFCCDPTFTEDVETFGEVSLLRTLPDEVASYGWKEPFGAPSESERKYLVAKENPRRVTRVNGDEWCIVIGSAILPLGRTLTWKIRVVRSANDDGDCICMGITPFDEDERNCSFEKVGWYYNCYNGKLWSGPPHSYCWKEYGPKFEEGTNIKTGDEVGVIMDTKTGNLSFVVHGKNIGVAFEGIPLDRPLVPAVLLAWEGDSVELIPEKY